MYTGVLRAFEWASREIIKTITFETGNIQKFAYVLYFAKTYGLYSVRLILSNYAWKQHVKLYSPIQKHVSLLHEKKLKCKKLLAIIKTQNEKIFTGANVSVG